jgi:hypothetical protein
VLSKSLGRNFEGNKTNSSQPIDEGIILKYNFFIWLGIGTNTEFS